MKHAPFSALRSQFVREAGTLVSGNAVAQAIALLAYLVLTRIYTPEDYALYNIFYSYIEVIIIASTCKYELAVIVARDEQESAAIARFALRLNTLVSIGILTIIGILFALQYPLPTTHYPLSTIHWIALLIPPMVFFCGTSRVYAALYNRAHRYRLIAAQTTATSGAAAVLKIVFGWLGLHSSGMPLGVVLGQGVANLLYRFRLRSLQLPKATRTQSLAAARKHRKFPLFVASKDFLNSLSANLPFLWLALYFDKAEVGLFGLALTFTCRPVSLFASAFERVLYARTAEAVRHHERILPMLRRFVGVLAAVAIPLFVAGWLLAGPVFEILFSQRWGGCEVYVQALLPWVLFWLTSSSLTFLSNVFSRQQTEFGFFLALLVLRVAAIAAGIMAADFLLAIRLYATAGTLVSASLLVWYFVLVRRYERSLR